MKNQIFIFLFITNFVFLLAQDSIPFTISKHNNIIFKTIVNEKDTLDLMFQISMNDAALSPNRTKKAESIRFQDEISENNTVQIGNLTWKNIRFFDNEQSGHETDGKIGKALFQNKIFAINYDTSNFTLYDELPDVKNYTSIPLLTEGEGFLIPASAILDWQENEMWFLMQSGFSGAIMFSNETAQNHSLGEILTITKQQEFQDSQRNKFVSKQAILPFLHFSNTVLKDVKVFFMEGTARVQTYNYFGADLMRRFNWIFDVENEKVYIQPSKFLREKYYETE